MVSFKNEVRAFPASSAGNRKSTIVKDHPVVICCGSASAGHNSAGCAESGHFLKWGSMGLFFTRCLILMKFSTRVRLKPSNHRSEFELDRAKSKNNISENPFALEHQTDNDYFCGAFSRLCQ